VEGGQPAEIRREEVHVGLFSVGREELAGWAVQVAALALVDVVPVMKATDCLILAKDSDQ